MDRRTALLARWTVVAALMTATTTSVAVQTAATADDGCRLTTVALDGNQYATVKDVAFSSAPRGFAVDSYGALYETEDGGGSWTAADYPFRDVAGVFSIAFLGDTGVAAMPVGRVELTTDGAQTWTVVRDDQLLSAVGWSHVDIPEAGTFVASGYLDEADLGRRIVVVATSHDNGQTWLPLVAPSVARPDLVDFADADHGVYVRGDALQVAVTDDGGRSWTNRTAPAPTLASEVREPAAGTIDVAVGSDLFRSTDNGATWTTVLHTDSPIRSFDVNSSTIAVVTDTGFLLSKDGGGTFSGQGVTWSPTTVRVTSPDTAAVLSSARDVTMLACT